MKFSPNGPDIPAKLIDAAIRGEVVFLCGAGVSLPSDLPNFPQLTRNVFTRLGLAMDAAEQHSFEINRYEEALGSLNRRLADRRSLYEAVAGELNADKATNTDAHATLVRLSRDFEGRPAVVTTNFDTLFERTLHEQTNEPTGDKSFAGAQVPAPAGPRFEGVIHLHGRLADKKLALDESDLVLTSADYGDAYLRSGWAARFLYDLARTRTIVLVGYSASDAPVRYILNILEADRERFPDLKTIYVLAQAKADDPNPHAEWDAIAVEPITFTVGFPEFWVDMAAWADLVELPRVWRKAKLTEFSSKQIDQLQPWEINQALWILSQEDGIDLVAQLPFSTQWIEFIRSQNLLKPDTRSDWALCRWAAARLDSTIAFQEVLKSANVIGAQAAGMLLRVLDDKNRKPIPAQIERAWRLLATTLRQSRSHERWMHYAAFARVKADTASGDDLREILKLFTPTLRLRTPYSFDGSSGDQPTLSTLCRREFESPQHPKVDDFLNVIPSPSSAVWSLIQLASGALLEALLLARDAELTGTRHDLVGYDVPSIADHPQNVHRGGFLPLVRLCAELWLRLFSIDPSKARMFAENWKLSEFPLVRRLWLFTLHRDAGLTTSAVVSTLAAMPIEDFWDHRKEIMELLRDRSRDAQGLDALASRIVAGPPLRDGLEPEARQRIRDSSIWNYLHAFSLGVAALPRQAQSALDDINARTNWNTRAFEESNFFKTWSSGVRRGPIGDAVPVAQAPIEKRIEVAAALEQRPGLDQTDVWHVYCHDDPEGALDALIAAADVPAQETRWRSLLNAIPGIGTATDEAKARGSALCVRVFGFLARYSTDDLKQLSHPLVDLYGYVAGLGGPIADTQWDRLWECSRIDDREFNGSTTDEDPGHQLLFHAINSAPGKLARLMIARLGPDWQSLQPADQSRTDERLAMMIADESKRGQLARAVLVEFAAWVHDSVPHLVDGLERHLLGQDAGAFALRSILVGTSRQLGPPLMARLKKSLLLGVVEHPGKSASGSKAASRIVAYVGHDLQRPADDPARLAVGEAKAILSKSSPEIRAAAADTLANWLSNEQDRPRHDLWRTEYAVMFEQLWPPEKKAQTNLAAVPLATLAMASGEAFPEALAKLKPYIVALDEDWPPVHFATTDDAKAVVDRFPRQMLELLWLLLQPASKGASTDLGETLDRIKAADPSLERDRRFQLLETRAMRL